eukprot:jgi/Picre1/31284/NNA_006637.t1
MLQHALLQQDTTLVTPNYSSACKYWKIAAKKAHPEALAMLAFEYYAGRGADKDPEEAYLLFNRFSSHVLAILILDNEFMSPFDKSTTSAVKWLKKSQMHGCPEAGKLLQSMFRNGQY